MKKLILTLILAIFLMGCAVQYHPGYITNSSSTTVEPAKTAPAPQPVVKQAPAPVQENKTSQPTNVQIDLSQGNKDLGYLPQTATITNLVKGGSVQFGSVGIVIVGIYNNAITLRVPGATMGDQFMIAKGSSEGIATKVGTIRISFTEQKTLYVEKIA